MYAKTTATQNKSTGRSTRPTKSRPGNDNLNAIQKLANASPAIQSLGAIQRKADAGAVLQGEFSWDGYPVLDDDDLDQVIDLIWDDVGLEAESAGVLDSVTFKSYIVALIQDNTKFGELSSKQVLAKVLALTKAGASVEEEEKPVWAMEGEVGVMSAKAYGSLGGVVDEDLQDALNTPPIGSGVGGVWNVIKAFTGKEGNYELKMKLGSSTTDQRWYGNMGASGKIEFITKARKGVGK